MLSKAKLEFARATLHRCPLITLVTRAPGVVLPQFLLDEPTKNLQIGRDPKVMGIPDLVLDEAGFSGTFAFNHALYFCRVPWSAVLVITARASHGEPDMQLLAPEPQSVSANADTQEKSATSDTRPVSPPRKHLRVIDGGKKPPQLRAVADGPNPDNVA